MKMNFTWRFLSEHATKDANKQDSCTCVDSEVFTPSLWHTKV